SNARLHSESPRRRCRRKSLTDRLKPYDGRCQNYVSCSDTSAALLRGETERFSILWQNRAITIYSCRRQNEPNFSRSYQWLETRPSLGRRPQSSLWGTACESAFRPAGTLEGLFAQPARRD